VKAVRDTSQQELVQQPEEEEWEEIDITEGTSEITDPAHDTVSAFQRRSADGDSQSKHTAKDVAVSRQVFQAAKRSKGKPTLFREVLPS